MADLPVLREKEFSARLNMACENNPHAPSGWGVQAWLRRELTKEGVKVYPESVRRWFAGESRPKIEMMSVVARILGVDEAWLSLGIKPASTPNQKAKLNTMATGAINLVAAQIQLSGGVIADPEVDGDADVFAIVRGKQLAITVRLAENESAFVLSVPARPKITIAVVPTDKPTQYRYLSVPRAVVLQSGTVRGSYIDVEVRLAGNGKYQIGKTALAEIVSFSKLDMLKEGNGISDGIE